MNDLETADLVVIGAGNESKVSSKSCRANCNAGWHGLAAAKTYLQVNPSADVLVIERASSLGGVWSKDRLYPKLKSNNILGTYEYSDSPLDAKTYGVKPGQHIPGEVIHRYLTDYAQTFGVNNIRFNTKVGSAEHKDGGGWLLTTSQASTENRIYASKLIVATGMTSEPFQPNIAGSENFLAPMFHFKDFKEHSDTLDTTQTVCVLGGTKSAWDVVYAYASNGQKVDWIIRESGHGPVWISHPYVTPLKKLLEKLVLTRFLTWFSPCIWGQADGYPRIRSFFHGTAIGRFIVNKFWGILGGDVLTLNNYDAHPETAKLKPWTRPFFVGAGLSILNYDSDIFEFVRKGDVRVHVADITSLGPRSVNLSSGETLSTDALVCCTGWKHIPPLQFLPAGNDLIGQTADIKDIRDVDEIIFTQLPSLKNQPLPNPKYVPLPGTSSTEELPQFALYRYMVPPTTVNTRDIAFSGSMMMISTALCAQIQALWITAYLNDQLPISSNVAHETLLHARFAKWRSPAGFGDRFPDLAFDSLPYLDMLMRDLGLSQRRKKSLLGDLFEPHGPADYKGIVGEWMKLNEDDEQKKTR